MRVQGTTQGAVEASAGVREWAAILYRIANKCPANPRS